MDRCVEEQGLVTSRSRDESWCAAVPGRECDLLAPRTSNSKERYVIQKHPPPIAMVVAVGAPPPDWADLPDRKAPQARSIMPAEKEWPTESAYAHSIHI